MRNRTEGHPLAGTLIIGAIFSVAFAFYLATPQPLLRATATHGPVTTFAAAIPAKAPTVVPPAISVPARVEHAILTAAVPQADDIQTTNEAPSSPSSPQPPSSPALSAFSWSAVPSPYPRAALRMDTSDAVRGAGPLGPAIAGGAVTHAFATAGSAVRSAFKKAF